MCSPFLASIIQFEYVMHPSSVYVIGFLLNKVYVICAGHEMCGFAVPRSY